MKWIFWLAACLLLILVVVQYFRGDVQGAPFSNLLLAAIFFIAGYAAEFIAHRMAK